MNILSKYLWFFGVIVDWMFCGVRWDVLIVGIYVVECEWGDVDGWGWWGCGMK